MASFFKFSCFIFWFAWVYYMGYLFGTQYFIGLNILTTPEVNHVEKYILAICLFNTTCSLIGCGYVKCNVAHVYASCLFVLPLIGINITLATYGVYAIQNASRSFPNASDFFETYNDHERFTLWEETGSCCGYYGFWDHASSILPGGSARYANLSSYIPDTCCGPFEKYQPCQAFIDEALVNRTNTTGKTILEMALNSTCLFPDYDKSFMYNHYNKSNLPVFHVTKNLEKVINTCGCYEVLLTAHMALYGYAHFVFIIVHYCTLFVMFIILFRNWCITRFGDGSSDHSLDEDSIIDEVIQELVQENEYFRDDVRPPITPEPITPIEKMSGDELPVPREE